MVPSLCLSVDGSVFEFPEDWDALKYDDWAYHSRLSTSAVRAKGCDIVAIHKDELYLIEAKDYTYPVGTRPPKAEELAQTVARKGFDTLAGLFSAAKLGAEHAQFCERALKCQRIQLVLSIEFPGDTRLFPGPNKRLAYAEHLKRAVAYIGGSPRVTSNRIANMPWTSRRDGAKPRA